MPIDYAMVTADANCHVTGWTHGAERLLGCSAAGLLGQDCASIYVEEEQARHREHHRRGMQAATPSGFDATLKTAAGERHPVRIETVPINGAGNMPAQLLIMIRATAELGTHADDIQTQAPSLLETSTRDANHRINNNLQDLVAMMRLQAAQRLSAEEAIDRSVAQLVAVSTAFALASRHGTAIPFSDLVAGIAGNAEQTSRRHIPLQVSAAVARDPIMLLEQHGATMALAINELLSNAIKPAAQDGSGGGVHIFIDRDEDSAELRIASGTGQPAAAPVPDSRQEADMGLGLVRLLLSRGDCALTVTRGAEGVYTRLVLRQPMFSDAHRALP
jgi:PAS domain S-box-containing protein